MILFVLFFNSKNLQYLLPTKYLPAQLLYIPWFSRKIGAEKWTTAEQQCYY